MIANYSTHTVAPKPLESLIVRQLESLLSAERRLTKGYEQLSKSEIDSEASNRFALELQLLDRKSDRLQRMLDALAVAA